MKFVSCCALLCFLVSVIVVSEALEGVDLQEAIKNLPTSKVEKSHKKFKFFDKDGDSFITREEFENGLKKLGYKTSEKKMQHIMSELDRDGNGKVEFHEFLRPTCQKHKEEKLLAKGASSDKVFELLDDNKDEKVSPEEFHAALSKVPGNKITLEQVQDFFKDFADVDGDNVLKYDEVETLDVA